MGLFRDNVLDFVLFVIIKCSSQYLAIFPPAGFSQLWESMDVASDLKLDHNAGKPFQKSKHITHCCRIVKNFIKT